MNRRISTIVSLAVLAAAMAPTAALAGGKCRIYGGVSVGISW